MYIANAQVEAGMQWLDDCFHLIRCQDDELPSIDWVLDLARAAVLRCASLQEFKHATPRNAGIAVARCERASTECWTSCAPPCCGAPPVESRIGPSAPAKLPRPSAAQRSWCCQG